jgi:hypothetical protein
MRSQQTTKRRDCFWNQANVRSAGKRGLSLFSGQPRGGLALPHPLRDLGTYPTRAELLPYGFGGIPLVCHPNRAPFPRSAWATRADLARLPQRQDLGPSPHWQGASNWQPACPPHP